jgi:hypothetical protein
MRRAPLLALRAEKMERSGRSFSSATSDRNLGTVGTAKLSTVGAPTPYVSETHVKRADAPKTLEYDWGGGDIRWELLPADELHRLRGTVPVPIRYLM